MAFSTRTGPAAIDSGLKTLFARTVRASRLRGWSQVCLADELLTTERRSGWPLDMNGTFLVGLVTESRYQTCHLLCQPSRITFLDSFFGFSRD